VACWSTKATISLKRVKVEEKLLWRAHHPRPPMASFSTRLGVCNFHPKPKTPIAISSGIGEATDFQFDQNIHRVHPNKIPLKFWRKGSVGASGDCPFFGHPQLSQEGVKLWTSNLAGIHSQGPSEQNPIKKFGKKGAWRIQGLLQFMDTTNYLRNGKATNFKFCTHIHSINRKKNPLKISRKVAVVIARDSRKFSGHSNIGRIAQSSLR